MTGINFNLCISSPSTRVFPKTLAFSTTFYIAFDDFKELRSRRFKVLYRQSNACLKRNSSTLKF